MRYLVLSIALVMSTAIIGPVAAQNDAVAVSSKPGQVSVAKTMQVTATITAIDKPTRDVTLKWGAGKELTLTAGPDVKNFDKFKVGDQVNATYIDALTLKLVKGGGEVVATTEQTAAVGAKPGEQPGGAVGRQVTVVANVIGLDPATQTVTLKGPNRTVDLVVQDPAQFKHIAKGDQIKATYTEALAMVLEPAAKK
jgi:Cu/Ag efflux protein CusF